LRFEINARIKAYYIAILFREASSILDGKGPRNVPENSGAKANSLHLLYRQKKLNQQSRKQSNFAVNILAKYFIAFYIIAEAWLKILSTST
jgi:hypothetical protein